MFPSLPFSIFFFFNDTATTEIYTLSLHDALPISCARPDLDSRKQHRADDRLGQRLGGRRGGVHHPGHPLEDRKSTRLNSSHSQISYAVFCLKKKKKIRQSITRVCVLMHVAICTEH